MHFLHKVHNLPQSTQEKATLPAALLISLFHLPARIPKLYKYVEALVHFWGKEEREPAESASYTTALFYPDGFN